MSHSKKLFWIALSLVALVLLVGYASLIVRSDHHAEWRTEGRQVYRNQMGWDQE